MLTPHSCFRHIKCTHPHPVAAHRAQKGVMLLEALIGVLIFSMGILAIVGLQASAISFTTDAKYRTDASFIANQAFGEMWGDRANLDSYVVTDDPVDSLPTGKRTIAVAGTQVTVTVSWKLPGQTTAHSYVAIAQING